MPQAKRERESVKRALSRGRGTQVGRECLLTLRKQKTGFTKLNVLEMFQGTE